MAVMAREAWTDERLDDLNTKVDEGFREMRNEFRAIRGENAGEFQAVRGEMQALHRTAMVVMVSGFATMLVGFAGTIATILLTQG
jgi:hypothetical protein